MHGEAFPCSSVQQAGTARRNDGLKTRAEETPPLSLSHTQKLLCSAKYQRTQTHDEFSVNSQSVHHDCFVSDLKNAGNVNGLETGEVVCALLK